MMDKQALILLARQVAVKFDLDSAVVCALVEVESNWNPWAIRFEPKYRWTYGPALRRDFLDHFGRSYKEETERVLQCHSFGLMQIMGAVARERGFIGWFPALCDPETNLDAGCRHLQWLLGRWPDINDAIAAYNHGHPEKRPVATAVYGCPPSTRLEYTNQLYVDKVVAAMKLYEEQEGEG